MVAHQSAEQAGHEPIKVNGPDFLTADVHFALAGIDGVQDFSGARVAWYAVAYFFVHLSMPRAVGVERIERRVRMHEAGADDGDGDPIFVDFGAQGIKESDERMFRCAVRGTLGRAKLSQQAADRHDLTTVALDHRGKHKLGEVDGREVVEFHDVPIDLHLSFDDRAALTDSRTMNEEVHLPESVENGADGRFEGVRFQ